MYSSFCRRRRPCGSWLDSVRIGYRTRQLWRTLTAKTLAPAERAEIRAVLSPEEYQLFLRYEMTDQQHCYRVMRTLRDAHFVDPELLIAALLHDVGKTEVSLTSIDRIVGSIAERSWRGSLSRWGNDPPEGWRRPFSVRVQHADWGATLAERAGSSTRVVCLIRRHQDKNFDDLPAEDAELLRLLQWADEQN